MPFCALLATSCIKDEPLNSECDIEVCKVHHEASDTIFYALSDTLQKVSSVDTVINFYTRSRINPQDLSQVRVTFDLTPGATITPASGSVQDFSQGGVVYTVVSEDKLWSRTYKVRFLPRAVLNPDFDFENVELEQPRERFYIWFAYDQNQKRQDLWATGNSGFALSRSSAKPHEYPSVMLEQGVSGKGVKLETCSTGAFGAMVNMRIAAGNEHALPRICHVACKALPSCNVLHLIKNVKPTLIRKLAQHQRDILKVFEREFSQTLVFEVDVYDATPIDTFRDQILHHLIEQRRLTCASKPRDNIIRL